MQNIIEFPDQKYYSKSDLEKFKWKEEYYNDLLFHCFDLIFSENIAYKKKLYFSIFKLFKSDQKVVFLKN